MKIGVQPEFRNLRPCRIRVSPPPGLFRSGIALAVACLWAAAAIDARADETAAYAGDNGAAEVSTDAEDEVPGETEAAPASPEAGQTAQAIGRLLGGLFFPSAGDFGPADEELSPLVGQKAPPFQLATATGEQWKLEDAHGKVVVLDFWATWCGPCVAAMPQLQELHEAFAKDGREVIIVGVNQQETVDDIEQFVEEHGITFPQVLDEMGTVGNSYQVSGIPQTVLIDADGIVQAVHVGYSPRLGATLNKQIETVLAGSDLFDEEEIRLAREKRLAATRDTREAIAEVNPERFERVASFSTGVGTQLSATSPPPSFKLPSGERALAVQSGDNQILLLEPTKNSGRLIQISWDDAPMYWELAAATSDQEIRWVALGYWYNDDFDLEKLGIAMFTESGESLWSVDVPVVSEYADISHAAGDFNGDGRVEIVALMNCSDVDLGPDHADVSRVLIAWDDQGRLVARKWLRGDGGTGLFVVAGEEGEHWLMQGADGIERMRLANANQ